MKLRVRMQRSTICISINDTACTIELVKSLIREETQTFENIDFHISLNGKDKLEDESAKLSDLGIVSGDLLHAILPQMDIVPDMMQHEPVPPLSPEISTDRLQTGSVNEPSTSTSDKTMNTDNDIAMESTKHPRLETELPDSADDLEIRRFLNEPVLLREATDMCVPQSLLSLYQSEAVTSPAEAVCVVIHLLMIESGYTTKQSEESASKHLQYSMPPNWRQSVGVYSLPYTHSVDTSTDVTVTCVPLGSRIIIHGHVCCEGEEQHRQIQIRSTDYVQCVHTDPLLTYKQLAKLSRVFKDAIALPLLQDLRNALGLLADNGMAGLPHELMLQIVRHLDVLSLVRMGLVCREFSVITKDAGVWRRAYVRKFGKKYNMDLNQNWAQLYKDEHMRRKALRKYKRAMAPVMPPLPFYAVGPPVPFLPPPPGPDMIGGDYDLYPGLPVGDPLGMNRRGPAIPSPRYDPLGPLPDLQFPPQPMGMAHLQNRHVPTNQNIRNVQSRAMHRFF